MTFSPHNVLDTRKPSMIDASTQIRFEEVGIGKPTRAIFVLHGYGDSATGILPLLDEIWHDDVVYIVPDGVSVCEGNEMVGAQPSEGRQWFSIQNLSPNVVGPTTFSVAKTLVHFINNQLGRLGIAHHNSVVFGFSQGGMLASAIGVSMTPPLGGIISCSGCVLPGDETNVICTATPHTLIHGKEDNIIPYETSQLGFNELRQAGVVAEGFFLDDLGHSIDGRVLKIVNQKLVDYLDL